MSKTKIDHPITQAVRHLRKSGIGFQPILFKYRERGGTRYSSEVLDVPEHLLIKTLVMETDDKKPLLILMHGDREVSLKQMARVLKTKKVAPCTVPMAEKLTGYQTGGISPFGTRTRMPIYIESSVLTLDEIYINGGKRGFFVKISPRDMKKGLDLTEINVAV